MKYVIVDLEMNPVSNEYPNERKVSRLETIQIGAVLLDEKYQEIGNFVTLVKPEYNTRIQKRYEKLTDTCKILSTRDVGYVATNPDLVCPIEFGFVPDCGAMCQMIEHAVKKKPYFIGKPEPGMVDMSVAQNHFTKDETLVIGDRLYTDILSGINAGVETALVLTGEATREDAEKSSYKPDYIFPTVRELHEAWK